MSTRSSGVDSLYEALEIPRAGIISCLAQTKSNNRCVTGVPNRRRGAIENHIKTIFIQDLNGEDDQALEAAQPSLKQLAALLICTHNTRMEPHARGIIVVDGTRYKEQINYISSVLDTRLRSWLSKKKEKSEKSQPKGQGTSNRSSRKSQIPVAIPKTRQTTRQYGAENNALDEKSLDRFQEARQYTNPQRPKLIRESTIGEHEEDLFMSARHRDSTHRNSYTYYQKEPMSPFSPLSPRGDALVMSPASVASPDPSEVFTPSSNISTPSSVSTTPISGLLQPVDFDSSPKKKSQKSPIRENKPIDESREVEDMMQKMKLDQKDLDDDDDDDEWCNPSKQLFVSSTSRRPMTFRLGEKPEESPVRAIFDCMVKPPRERYRDSGYVYCFAEKSAPGYLKIGFTLSSELQETTELPISSWAKKHNKDKVKKRLQEQERKCGHDIDLRFQKFMPCAVQKMEALVHRTLHHENRMASCPALKCSEKHREWFEVSEDIALGVVEVWQEFSRLMPYNAAGELSEVWKDYASSQRRECILTTTELLDTEWAEQIIKVRNSNKVRLRNDLAEAQERRKMAEWQFKLVQDELLGARKGEERIQQELTKLEDSSKSANGDKHEELRL
ncbi:hypothetical protein F66182_388 [Fusarium sp. NRRL 66182]|nr:hypothetical protein F66182_388 [Fusarium sp. NRRL 66182]